MALAGTPFVLFEAGRVARLLEERGARQAVAPSLGALTVFAGLGVTTAGALGLAAALGAVAWAALTCGAAAVVLGLAGAVPASLLAGSVAWVGLTALRPPMRAVGDRR